MNKAFSFFRSMTFGMILLGLITAFSAIGSWIPQNAEPMTYVRAYPSMHRFIFALSLDHVFTSWYFILIAALLCLNLTLCSLLRISSVAKNRPALKERALSLEKQAAEVNEKTLAEIRGYLESRNCRKEERGGNTVYSKNDIGWYGSFLTHLGLLLTILLFGAAMYLPVISDQTCLPGKSLVLDDGTDIYVDSFRIEDGAGRLDYTSVINITLPGGKQSGLKEVSVNHPAAMGRYKVYQQTYGTAGSVTAERNGNSEQFFLEHGDFLSADGKNGIVFDELYPGFVTDEEGHTTLITSVTGRYTDPVYVFTMMENGSTELMMAFPGDTVEVGDLVIRFDEPTEFPGLRIKKTPPMINLFLLAAFLVMTAGIYLAMFVPPVLVSLDESGFTVLGPKAEGMRIELNKIVKRNTEEK